MHQRQLFLQHVAQTSHAPLMLEIAKAEGCILTDVHGKTYIDLISGIAVSNVGHGHPKVKAAIHAQTEKYLHVMVYGEVIESPQVQYATWLAQQLPENLNSVYFVNSGSEATECALKLAKRVTGRSEIVSCAHAYHGSTMGALSAGNDESRKQAFRPLIPDNTLIPYLDYSALERITDKTAAVLIEPVQAEAGIRIPDQAYLMAVRKKCTETGALLIFDECQTAFGRTGSLFRCTAIQVIPDILTLGKAVGGGLPLGACISSREAMQTFTTEPILGHITTFGGHPLCCAAGLAAAQVLMEEQLLDSVEQKGKLFDHFLQHAPGVTGYRRCGLMIAVDLPDVEINMQAVSRLVAAGVFIDWFLYAPASLRIAPPLTISEPEIILACSKITEVLEQLQTSAQ